MIVVGVGRRERRNRVEIGLSIKKGRGDVVRQILVDTPAVEVRYISRNVLCYLPIDADRCLHIHGRAEMRVESRVRGGGGGRGWIRRFHSISRAGFRIARGVGDGVNLLVRQLPWNCRQVVVDGGKDVGGTIGAVGHREALVEPSIAGAHHGLRLALAMAERIGKVHARGPVAFILDFILRFPAQSIAEGETAIDGPIVLIKQG